MPTIFTTDNDLRYNQALNLPSQVYAGLELAAALPFLGHGFHGRWGVVHDMVLEEADETLIMPSLRSRKAYLDRNCYMVAQSSRLLCCYGGQPGGTAHSVRRAVRNGLEVHSLADYDLTADLDLKTILIECN